MKKNQVSVAILAAAIVSTLSGCSDRPVPPRPVQMTQACGQSMQTGNMECIMVPVGQANPYPQSAPAAPAAPAAPSSGVGVGGLLGAAALGAGAGYLAGRNTGSTPAATTSYNSAPMPGPVSNGPTRANTVAPAAPVTSSGFQSQSASTMGTIKPMTIPASAQPPVAPRPMTAFSPSAAVPRPTTTFSPSAAAPRPMTAFAPSATPTPVRQTVSPAPAKSFAPSRTSSSRPSTSFSSSSRK